ncbi:MAG TPA: hypothetical protein VFT84_16790 [Gemmatimonadales bacterium]|nr:hypothetical protein [Gemmatimonadales bacterium]
MPSIRHLLSLLPLAAAAPAAGQTTARPDACTAAEHHQFDFWIGEWDVTLPNGKVAGTNRIEPILGGCALRESWTGAGGGSGTSYNAYDRSRRVWHQTWVDGQGNLLQLEGSFSGGRMTLTGETVDSAGAKATQRITWEETGPGQVRQLWETSTDGGSTWKVSFDGRYRKRK